MLRVAGSAVLALSLVSVLGCGGGGEEGGGEAGESESESEGGDPSEGLEQHGTVFIELAALGGEASVFTGTASVELTVFYLECLEDFYRTTGLDWRQDGELGAPVFEAYPELLCGVPGAPACTVESITSTIDNVESEYTLSVRYAIEDASTLDGSQMLVGPVALAGLTGCTPSVQLRSMGAAGFDAGGEQIWRIGTISGTNEAAAGELAPIRVEIVEQ